MTMIRSINTCRYTKLLVCLSALFLTSGCDLTGAARNLLGLTKPPKVGLRITKVLEGGNAEQAGLHPMDLISKYGTYQVVDDATYFAARQAYAKSFFGVQLEVWRGRQRLTPMVPAGRLGVETNEYNPVMYKFQSIMQRLDMRSEIPEHLRDREFKDEFSTPPEKILDEARAVIDQAAREGSLTPTQILVARIYMILDDAPPAALKQQSELLTQFLATQPDGYIDYLGHDILFQKKRYRSAMECFKQHLKAVPDDVSTRLNLGVVSNDLGMFDEAEAAADYVLENKLGISDYGMIVLSQVKATAALGKHEYSRSIAYAEKGFEAHRTPYEISLIQLAAAQTGDLETLAAATSKFQKVLPADFEQRKCETDAIEAYALAKTNKRDHARQLVMKWKNGDRIEGRVNEYWRVYPSGDEVAKNWRELAKN